MGYQFIDKQQDLDLAVSVMGRSQYVSVDTESSSFYTYESELCLIQISASGKNYLIDPLSNLTVDGLAEIFANPSIVKVMHTAASDISELRRLRKFKFENLFDIMVGCRMLGFVSCSLVSLVKHYTGRDLEKTEQKSNWKKRPLTASQMEYAHRDTIYLEEIMKAMKVEIEKFGFADEFAEDMIRIIKESYPVERIYDHDSWKHVPGAFQLSPIGRGFLKALLEIRESRARKDNIAPFRLGSNDALLNVAERMPDSISELSTFGLHPDFVRKEGERILEMRNKSPQITNADSPREKRKPPDPALARLKKWRKDVAEYRGFEPSIILSNRQLEAIMEARPSTMEDLARLDLLTDWKLEHYGPMVLSVLAGKEPPLGDLKRLPPERRRPQISG